MTENFDVHFETVNRKIKKKELKIFKIIRDLTNVNWKTFLLLRKQKIQLFPSKKMISFWATTEFRFESSKFSQCPLLMRLF